MYSFRVKKKKENILITVMQYIFLKLNPLLYLTKSNISLQLHEKPPVNSLPHPSKNSLNRLFFFPILLISICRRVTINVILLIIIIIPPNALNSSHYLLRRLESLPYTSISLSSPPPHVRPPPVLMHTPPPVYFSEMIVFPST